MGTEALKLFLLLIANLITISDKNDVALKFIFLKTIKRNFPTKSVKKR